MIEIRKQMIIKRSVSSRRLLVNPMSASHRQSKQAGFGLLEVLVALVVVSFGVLGMASLQLTGMKHSSGSFNRSKASMFAQNMASRIRLNALALETQDYAAFDSDTDVSCAAPPAPYCQARAGGVAPAQCDVAELADFDTFSISCGDVGPSGADAGVIGSLPNGRLTIDCLDSPCGTASAYNVTVTWTEGRSRSDTGELDTKRVQVRLKP